jgi:hypothetical protein
MNVSKNSGCLLGLACWNLHRTTAEQRYVRPVGNCGGSIVTVEQFSVCSSNWCVQNWLYKYESMGGLALNHGTFFTTHSASHALFASACAGGGKAADRHSVTQDRQSTGKWEERLG